MYQAVCSVYYQMYSRMLGDTLRVCPYCNRMTMFNACIHNYCLSICSDQGTDVYLWGEENSNARHQNANYKHKPYMVFRRCFFLFSLPSSSFIIYWRRTTSTRCFIYTNIRTIVWNVNKFRTHI